MVNVEGEVNTDIVEVVYITEAVLLTQPNAAARNYGDWGRRGIATARL